MKSKFEQLIEYVINNEEEKARVLFHDIVVEKSRQIYEEMMDEEELDEAAEEDLDEAAEEDLDENEELDEDEELDETRIDMGNDMGSAEGAIGEMGGDASDDLMMDVESEETGMQEDEDFADEEGMSDMGGDEDLEDRVVDLEDKLDELMAEFEQLMGDDDMDMHGGDELEMDDTEEFGSDEGDEEFGGEEELDLDMMEAVSLKAAPKPTTSEEGGINKKSTVAANSGARGMEGKPVHTGTSMGGKHDTSAYSNSHKDLISDFQNKAGTGMKDMKAAPKPVTSQASGVNNKSPLKGR